MKVTKTDALELGELLGIRGYLTKIKSVTSLHGKDVRKCMYVYRQTDTHAHPLYKKELGLRCCFHYGKEIEADPFVSSVLPARNKSPSLSLQIPQPSQETIKSKTPNSSSKQNAGKITWDMEEEKNDDSSSFLDFH